MNDAFADLSFPVRGTDLSPGFGAQPMLTTPSAVNVRAWEPVTGRARGGTRPGLFRFVAGQLPTAGKIQHLNVVVDPSADALLVNLDYPGPDAVDDPSSAGPPSSWPARNLDPVTGLPLQSRNPGRLLRLGGNGYPSNKNKRATRRLTVTANDQSKTQGSTFAFAGTEFTHSPLTAGGSVAAAALASAGAAAAAESGTYPVSVANAVGTGLSKYRITYVPGTMTVTSPGLTFEQDASGDAFGDHGVPADTVLPSPVSSGQLVVVCARVADQAGGVGISLSDNFGSTYHQVASYVVSPGSPFPPDGVTRRIGLWYAVVGFAGALTVTSAADADPGDPAKTGGVLGVCVYSGNAASPLESSSSKTGGLAAAIDTGTIGVSVPASLLIAIFDEDSFSGYAADPGETSRAGGANVVEKNGVSAGAAVTAAVADTTAMTYFSGIGASFRKA